MTLLATVFCVAWVSIAPVEAAEVERTLRALGDQSADSRYELASQAYRAGDIETALQIVKAIARDRKRARDEAAVEVAPEASLSERREEPAQEEPVNDRARLDQAKAKYETGDFEGAETEFRSVLEKQPPETVQRNIQKFLDRIQAEKKRKKGGWAGEMTAGILHDDNVNVGPDSRLVRIAPIRFGDTTFDKLEVSEESQPKESWGEFLYGTVAGHFDPGEPGEWGIDGGANYYQNWLADNSDYEILYAKGFVGPRRSSSNHLLELPAAVEYIEQGGESFAAIYSIRPAHTVSASKTLFWTTEGDIEYRDYTDFDIRDSLYAEARESMRRFFGKARHSFSLSLAGFYEDAEAGIYDSQGFEALVTGEISLPWSAGLYAHGRYRGSWYDEQEELAPEKRRDGEWQAAFGLNADLSRRWTLDLGYQHTTNTSTFDLYEYKRNILTMSGTLKL